MGIPSTTAPATQRQLTRPQVSSPFPLGVPVADRRKELARIHCLKRDLGFDDDLYRDVLEKVAGVRSAGKLDDSGRRKVIVHLAALVQKAGKTSFPDRPTNMDENPGLYKIEAQLAAAKRPWSYAHSIARRMFNRDRVQWCRPDEISAVIAALAKDAERHGREYEG